MNTLCEPIASHSEPIYASIVRNRFVIDSGCIDYSFRNCAAEELCDADKQDITNTAYALYESICRVTKKRAFRDHKGAT